MPFQYIPAFKYRGVIDQFSGEYAFLSNFYQGTVKYRGITFTTAEHAYQCQKIPEKLWHKINSIKLARNAKLAVKTMLHDKDRGFAWDQAAWDAKKVDIMLEVLLRKFSNLGLWALLDRTSPAELVEGNTWNDKFWGVPVDRHGFRTKPGENMLGKLLMHIRDDLKWEDYK